MNDMSESSKQLLGMVNKLWHAAVNTWLQNSLFTWRWWLEVLISIIPWVIWIYFREKKSTNRLLYVGFFAIIIAFIIDTIGISFGLWFYEYRVVPIIQVFIPWDFSLIPVSILLLLQIKPNKFLWIKTLFFAAFSAFIAEPIFHWLKFYNPINWRHTYSFILYLILFLICSFLINRKNFENL